VSPAVERLALCALIMFFISPAHAGSIGPGATIHGRLGCSDRECLAFGWTAPRFESLGVGDFASLIATKNLSPVVTATCSERVFTCGIISFGRDQAKLALTLDNHPETVPSGATDAFLGCRSGECPAWDVSAEVDVASADVPEPGTMLLLSTGLALLTRRKRRPSPKNTESWKKSPRAAFCRGLVAAK